MKKILLTTLLLINAVSFAQIRRAKGEIQPIKTYPIQIIKNQRAIEFAIDRFKKEQEKWFKFNRINLSISEMAFSNWSAGGDNSVTALLNAQFRRRFSETTYFWDNELEINYGANAQKGRGPRKTDDKFSITSSFGYRGNSKSRWYYTAKSQFLTQIYNGYAYPNTETAISKFMAPAHFTLGIGLEFVPDAKRFNIFISPITHRMLFVLDKTLADQGAFGVDKAEYDANGNMIKPGKKTKSQLGFYVSGNWRKEIAKNMQLENRFNFYGDYLKNVGNIDIDWESTLNLKVNTYVQARIGIHLKYDDDIKFYSYKGANGAIHQYGARPQLKQMLAAGLSYTF